MDFFEKKLSSKLQYSCFFMQLFEDEVLLPNKEKSTRIYIKHDGAACVLPITKENTILLIKQFRYPINGITIEVPAGKKDSKNESGLECVTRELEEETGYTSDTITFFRDLHNCLGYSDEKIEMFIATNCTKVDHPKQGDADEFIEVLEVTKEEAKELLMSGVITDAKTQILLQHYLYGGM